MTPTSGVLMALALTAVSVSASAAPPASAIPKGWFLTSPGDAYSSRVDGDEKHSGRGSGLLECDTSDVDEFGVLNQTFKAEAYRGRRIRLSGFMRTRGVEGSARMWLRVDGPDTSPLAFDNMAKRPVRGDTEWSLYEIVLDVPAAAVQIGYGGILGGKGRLWLDDFRVDVVGDDVPTTDMHVPAVAAKAVVSPDLPAQPVNRGFEE